VDLSERSEACGPAREQSVEARGFSPGRKQEGPLAAPSVYAVASSPRIVQLALRMSLVVGTLLNLINQGDALFGSAQLDLFKLGLTYLVPYCVATYSATSVTLEKSSSG
jgi:hypothetical protein